MAYVDGFVIPIQKKNLAAYKRLAKMAGKVWKKYGALDYKECVGDDLAVRYGLPFSKLSKLKTGETVVFSFIVYKSKAHRDQVNKKVMKDPAILNSMKKGMPFDDKRMAWGGFKVLVSL
jgi:uncharacterized protein YbaA (DUF1428 family)